MSHHYPDVIGPHQITVVNLRSKPGAVPSITCDNTVPSIRGRWDEELWQLAATRSQVKFELEDWDMSITSEYTDTYKMLRAALDHETAIKAIDALNTPLTKTVSDCHTDQAGH